MYLIDYIYYITTLTTALVEVRGYREGERERENHNTKMAEVGVVKQGVEQYGELIVAIVSRLKPIQSIGH